MSLLEISFETQLWLLIFVLFAVAYGWYKLRRKR